MLDCRSKCVLKFSKVDDRRSANNATIHGTSSSSAINIAGSISFSPSQQVEDVCHCKAMRSSHSLPSSVAITASVVECNRLYLRRPFDNGDSFPDDVFHVEGRASLLRRLTSVRTGVAKRRACTFVSNAGPRGDWNPKAPCHLTTSTGIFGTFWSCATETNWSFCTIPFTPRAFSVPSSRA